MSARLSRVISTLSMRTPVCRPFSSCTARISFTSPMDSNSRRKNWSFTNAGTQWTFTSTRMRFACRKQPLTPFGKLMVSEFRHVIMAPSVLRLMLTSWPFSPRQRATMSRELTPTETRAARSASLEMPAAFLPVRCSFRLLCHRESSRSAGPSLAHTSADTESGIGYEVWSPVKAAPPRSLSAYEAR